MRDITYLWTVSAFPPSNKPLGKPVGCAHYRVLATDAEKVWLWFKPMLDKGHVLICFSRGEICGTLDTPIVDTSEAINA